MKYVIYTSDKAAVDAAFSNLGFSTALMGWKSAESGKHRVAVFNALDGCFNKMVKPLVDQGLIEFLGCEENCDSCCRDNPSKNFTEDDNLKVDLANARELF